MMTKIEDQVQVQSNLIIFDFELLKLKVEIEK